MRPHKDKILSILREIAPVLSERYGVTRIGIFGSVARDDASEASDVDIVYEMSRPNLFTVVHLKDELENILHCTVDLVRYRERMNPFLKKRIEKDGVYV
ncbi:nucleotidyltransferase family protein [Planctomycetota bacterium]|jgi:predicted nucleotidyltransferase